jgi:hypothetical protein
LFSEFQVRASFFFPLGLDCPGRYPSRAWASRAYLPWQDLLRGGILPARDFGSESRRLFELARKDGHDVGLVGVSPFAWAEKMAIADSDWVGSQFAAIDTAVEEWCPNDRGGLASMGWQVHPALIEGLVPERAAYSSVCRGKMPFYPVLQGKRSAIPEIPTTLPTVQELLLCPEVTLQNVHEYLYAESCHVLPAGHVFTLFADREGIAGITLMEKLLTMWKGQDGSVRALGDVLREVNVDSLPHHQVGWGRFAGARGYMATQSLPVSVASVGAG